MGNVDIFTPFRSHQNTLYNFTFSFGYFQCLLQCKIPEDIIFFSCILKPVKLEGVFQKKNLGIFSFEPQGIYEY